MKRSENLEDELEGQKAANTELEGEKSRLNDEKSMLENEKTNSRRSGIICRVRTLFGAHIKFVFTDVQVSKKNPRKEKKGTQHNAC